MKRIQRERRNGWRKPHGNILNVTRPSRHGNPYPVSVYGLEDSLMRFTVYLDVMERDEPEKYKAMIDEVRKADAIMCWCKVTQRCHGDIWIRRAKEKRG